MSPQTARRRTAAPALGAAALVLAAAALLVALGGGSFGDRLDGALARPAAPARALGSEKLRRALVRSERIALHPPAVGGGCDGAELATRPLAPAAMPSSVVAPAPWRSGAAPLVSLWVEPCRLERLHERRFGHGREFEEVGWVSWFEGGELRFASPVGVRIHGGASRKHSPYSYRLYFRPSYGSAAPPGALVDAAILSVLEHVVVAKDTARDRRGIPWRFIVPIVDEIGRELGGVAPRSRPAWFSLGGAEPALYTLSESIRDDFLERRFGHAEFDVVRAKQLAPEGDDLFRHLEEMARAAALPAPLRQVTVELDYDLEAITAWYTTALLCATGDLFQATLVRDRTRAHAGGRWIPVHWDMDMSFVDPRAMSRFGSAGDVLPATLRRIEDPRFVKTPWRTLLTRLLREDPAYRARLAASVTRALNHQLSPGEIAALLARQRERADLFGLADRRFLDELERFFARRPGQLFEQLERHLDVGPPLPVRVAAPPGSVLVDGYPTELPYRGLYPRGLTITVEVEPPWRRHLLGFRVNGSVQLAPSGRLELEMRAATAIEALFEDGASSYGSRSTG